MKIQADKKETKKIADDMQILYSSSGIYAVINKYAKILAYQYALNKVNFDIYKEISIFLTQAKKNQNSINKSIEHLPKEIMKKIGEKINNAGRKDS